MRIMFKIGDLNTPEKWAFMEIDIAINTINDVPESVVLEYQHKLHEEAKIEETTTFRNNIKHRATKKQGQYFTVSYTDEQKQELSTYQRNLQQAKMYHKNEINFMEPIMNFSKPYVEDDTSILRDDNSTTGPKTSRRTSIKSLVKPKRNLITTDARDVYRVDPQKTLYGQRNYPYKLYPKAKGHIALNRQKHSYLPQEAIMRNDPNFHKIIMDKIMETYGNINQVTEEMWNRAVTLVLEQREESRGSSSQSHSITLIRSGNRSETASQGSLSPKSPMKEWIDHFNEAPQFIYAVKEDDANAAYVENENEHTKSGP